jgi:hypothetical protein
VIDFYSIREQAEETLIQVLKDEHGWAGMLESWRSSSGRRPRA